MHWFLTTKYLRYISEEGKGKRKMMKKHLYIKFKNEVMLPYIESLLWIDKVILICKLILYINITHQD